ncbi:MAG: hypothetical protein ABSE77_08540 [Acidimicrobiales bacterium]|jgi:hypothetical protein
MSQHDEPVLPGGPDAEIEQGAAAVPVRNVVAPARVPPKPLGRWGVMAWVWELRDRGAQPTEQDAHPTDDDALVILPESADQKTILLGDDKADIGAGSSASA